MSPQPPLNQIIVDQQASDDSEFLDALDGLDLLEEFEFGSIEDDHGDGASLDLNMNMVSVDFQCDTPSSGNTSLENSMDNMCIDIDAVISAKDISMMEEDETPVAPRRRSKRSKTRKSKNANASKNNKKKDQRKEAENDDAPSTPSTPPASAAASAATTPVKPYSSDQYDVALSNLAAAMERTEESRRSALRLRSLLAPEQRHALSAAGRKLREEMMKSNSGDTACAASYSYSSPSSFVGVGGVVERSRKRLCSYMGNIGSQTL